MSDFKKFCTDEKLSPVQVVGARKAWQHQQSKIDELQKQVGDLIYKAKLRESDHQALLVKYQATKKCWEDVSGKCEELKTQLNSMEACYIEKKKQVEDALSRIESLMVHAAADYENTKSTSMMCAVQELAKALRGERD